MSQTSQPLFNKTIPQHVAIIMDGNGRWAKQRNLRRYEGHEKGVDRVKEIIQSCREMNIPYLTLYTFSTENWSRTPQEINTIMRLLTQVLTSNLDELSDNGIKLHVIGDIQRLPLPVRNKLKKALNHTAANTKLNVILALSYGSRWEILNAVKQIAKKVQLNQISFQGVTNALIEQHLSTAGMPDPDLLIRTSGEQRISNFLLYQMAYTELYFTRILWPDFTKNAFKKAIAYFQERNRTFGGN